MALVVVKSRKRENFDRTLSLGVFCAVTALTVIVTRVSTTAGGIDWEKTNLVDAYHDYGFA